MFFFLFLFLVVVGKMFGRLEMIRNGIVEEVNFLRIWGVEKSGNYGNFRGGKGGVGRRSWGIKVRRSKWGGGLFWSWVC